MRMLTGAILVVAGCVLAGFALPLVAQYPSSRSVYGLIAMAIGAAIALFGFGMVFTAMARQRKHDKRTPNALELPDVLDM